ncbi:regulatory protein abaA [Parachaetomium inaequale]|uniref:Regulatory protein abaA n=1 Tax=Parachaetomium inaequale TaxID=2588326 RepID=A0AAN6SRP6_9PEZI|nr:regulatory protein abaA [Parachaetomium inaequale]
MAWYAQHLEALSSIPSSIPPVIPPVLRTQSLGPDYGVPADPRSQQRHELHPHGRRRSQGSNPLMALFTPAFQNYRKKQADKQDQKWPEALEGHFLDALLLIPHMGRNKYTMKQRLNGRNQLIGEYLWIASCHDLGRGAEPDPHLLKIKNGPNGRKMVSSHIQVLKKFFAAHRCFHFLFGQRQRDKEADHIEKVSLKNNPILIALSKDRFPDERPNYEYFSQILALNEQVQFRPKRCWIFVSHPDVVVSDDGFGYLPGTDTKLGEAEYPHLPRNLQRDTWAKEEQQLFKGALLHEFTKEIDQVESSSVKDLSKKWESAFPDLQQRLKAITSTTTDAKCDILHLHATLELKEKRSFPPESSLSSWVEINIEQPRLLNHRWRVETRLVRPPELSYSHDDSHEGSAQGDICERHKEFTIKYQHQLGCDGSRSSARGHCDCLAQRSRRDGFSVPFPIPFPATAWAQTLTNCAEYPAHPYSGSKRHDRERGSAARAGDDDEDGSRSRRRSKQPTQMDLVPRIAMMQEIFSCPPTSVHNEGSSDTSDQRWTRRAVILWTFETIHSISKDSKRELVTAPGGRTNWRFLTILDPASEYHAIISGRRASTDEYRGASSSLASSSRPASRATIMSPSPSYQQHLGANMRENFSSAWDSAGGLGSLSGPAAQAYGAHFMSQTIPSHAGAASQAGYGLLDSFSSHSGLATPPPTASLASSFTQPFDTASTNSDMLPSYLATHAVVTTAADMDASSHTLGGSTLSAVTDPFLSHVGTAYGGGTQDGIHGWDSHGVTGGGMDNTTAASWPSSGYSHTNEAQMHSGTNMGWPGPQPQMVPSRRGSEQQQHHHSHRQTQHRGLERQQQQQPWTSTTANLDDHDPWTPLASETDTTPAETISTRAGSHNPTGRGDTSQEEWVHIIHNASASSSRTASGSASDDVSQDWEEDDEEGEGMHTLRGTGEHSQHSESPSSAAAVAGEVRLHAKQQQHGMHHINAQAGGGGGHASSLGMVVSRKRARSDDSFGEDEGAYRGRRGRGG